MSEYSREVVLEMIEMGDSLADLDLSGIDLSFSNLAGADFRGTNLASAN